MAVTIDFEANALGEGITDVNALTIPLGATFDVGPVGQARPSGTFEIVLVDSNNVARTGTEASEADVLVNFSTGMDFVEVTFRDNPNGANLFVSLTAYPIIGTADAAGLVALQLAGAIASTSGTEPSVLSLSAPGIRSVQIESFSGQLYFDNVRFSAPEPMTVGLIALALAGLGWSRHRLST